MVTIDEDDYLAHYGIRRKSGRYPWGSGGKYGTGPSDTESQRSKTFTDVVRDLEAQGMSRKDIAEGFGMTTTQLRDTVTIANNYLRREKQVRAETLRGRGWSHKAIADEMGLPNESSVRALLAPSARERAEVLENIANALRDEVDKGEGWLDIGKGTEYYVPGVGVSKEKLRSAVSLLKDEGYVEINVQSDQVGMGPGKKTMRKVLCPPGTTYRDVVTSVDKIRTLTPVFEAGGISKLGIQPPMRLDSKRIAINYKEDGGHKADGVIYVRRGVKDISLGGSAYAQVRINVDDTHYLKGMAMYKDDMPPGVDILFNTNKSKSTPMMGPKDNTVLKPQSEDKDNPFGAVIRRQITEKDADGNDRLTSVMNILQEEGDWDNWSRSLSAQVLSKQSTQLATRQLDRTYQRKKEELDEILRLTNPTVREKLLEKYAEEADSAAVHLKAAAMPRSSYHVILPFNSLKDNEVYAPNFENGERLALIRYPHGGKFEIPELIVNNNAPAPKAAVGRAKDVVGINYRVAERLSGADFDGDFVMAIPNNSGDIKSRPPLKQLENFDPQTFKLPDGVPAMSARTKGKEMGLISNLITDMTIQGATDEELSRAVRHSMVVIDAEKHRLDYKRSAQQFGISALKAKYQNGDGSGASTLISRATSEVRVNKRRKKGIDRGTGQIIYEETGDTRKVYKKNRKGEVTVTEVPIQEKSTKLAETDDAFTLSSGTRMESAYASHSNRLKALANQARKEYVNNTDGIPYSPSANKAYKDEVTKLENDLKIALMNSPRERNAQTIAAATVALKRQENPNMDAATLKKVKAQALAAARVRAGAERNPVPISDRQWEAIQAGAISKSKLRQILDNADIDRVRELATPRPQTKLQSNDLARARAMSARGLTQAEIARALGVGLTTLKEGLANG